MDKLDDPSYLYLIWSILVAAITALLAIGSFRAKVATKDDLTKEVKDLKEEHKKSLYREDGTTIFVPRAECDKNQVSCGDRVCAKLTEIKNSHAASLVELREDTRRRHEEHLAAQRAHLELHGDLAEFVGAVKQFMQHHKEG